MATRAGSVQGGTPDSLSGGGGSIPTPALLRKGDWWVSNVSLAFTREAVRQWHYSRGGSNTAVYTHGLFPKGMEWWEPGCVGVAWWLPPTKNAAMAFDRGGWKGVLALSRLAIHPDVPANAASFLIRHSMRQIDRKRWPVLVTYADQWQEHTGAIYKATGWTECGLTKPERTYVLNGRMVSRKAGPKTRTHEQMLAMGATCVGKFCRVRFMHRIDGR